MKTVILLLLMMMGGTFMALRAQTLLQIFEDLIDGGNCCIHQRIESLQTLLHLDTYKRKFWRDRFRL
jgi:hypothetical protein